MFVFPPTLSPAYSLACPFGQKMVQRSLSSFPAIESGKFQLPMKFRRHFRWRLTQLAVKKETKQEKKMLKISCVCVTPDSTRMLFLP